MQLRSVLAALFAVAASPALVAAQSATGLPNVGEPEPPPEGAPPQLAEIDRQGLQRHVYWLAADERAGRYTSSQGQRDTAAYVAEHFEQLGLAPLGDKRSFLQTYRLGETALDKRTGLQFGRSQVTDHFAVLPSGDDKVSLSGRFVYCGGGRAEELPSSLKGRIPLVVFDKLPRGHGVGGDLQAIQLYTTLARQLANREARAGVVALPGDPGAFGNTLNYHALQPDHPRLSFGSRARGQEMSVPLFVVGGEAAEELIAHVKDDDKASGKLQIAVKTTDRGSACNVVAVLEGDSRSREAVVISAHHDHVGRRIDGDAFNGADDNASGTAGLLEIAEAFARGARPERSIVFLSVSGEELGLWGSAWFADNPTWPLDRIVADVNIDMIGRAKAVGDGSTEMLITPSKGHEHYSTLVRAAAQRGAQFGIRFASGDQYYQRSDHYNFARKGIPVVFFCDGEHPDYHKVTDEADKLDYARMEAVARLAFWTAWQTAQQDGRPERLGRQADW